MTANPLSPAGTEPATTAAPCDASRKNSNTEAAPHVPVVIRTAGRSLDCGSPLPLWGWSRRRGAERVSRHAAERNFTEGNEGNEGNEAGEGGGKDEAVASFAGVLVTRAPHRPLRGSPKAAEGCRSPNGAARIQDFRWAVVRCGWRWFFKAAGALAAR